MMTAGDPISSDSQVIRMLLLVRDMQERHSCCPIYLHHSSLRMQLKMGDFPKGENVYVQMSNRCPLLCEILDARTEASVSMSKSLNILGDFIQVFAIVLAIKRGCVVV